MSCNHHYSGVRGVANSQPGLYDSCECPEFRASSSTALTWSGSSREMRTPSATSRGKLRRPALAEAAVTPPVARTDRRREAGNVCAGPGVAEAEGRRQVSGGARCVRQRGLQQRRVRDVPDPDPVRARPLEEDFRCRRRTTTERSKRPSPTERTVSGCGRLLSRLPPKERQLLTWLFFEGRDKDRICGDLQVDRDYLRVLLHRAERIGSANSCSARRRSSRWTTVRRSIRWRWNATSSRK